MFSNSPRRSNRTSVRADDDALRQLDEMAAATGASVSEIVRTSLSAEYARVKAKRVLSERSAIVANAGKYRSTGASAGSPSTSYKTLFSDSKVGVSTALTNSRV
jgi:predicted transcriptional regulator